jgi:hydroxymethylpyrimidine/phosphomethylpyrimidine kinase
MSEAMTPPVALSIAGSDSGGSAGIQADLRTFAAMGVFGTTAVTAVTAQNGQEVRSIHLVPAEEVRAQALAVLDDLPVAAVKTGLLASVAVVRIVAELAAAGRLTNLVVDPVLVSTTGAKLAADGVVDAYLRDLLPLATVFTPNLAEAGVLTGAEITTLAGQREVAKRLGQDTAAVVVVKGGHPITDVPGDAVDVVWDGTNLREVRRPRIATANSHGSGCTFAAAVTAGLARSQPVDQAVDAAGDFVHRALLGSVDWRLGGGHGPLDHLGWSAAEQDRA